MWPAPAGGWRGGTGVRARGVFEAYADFESRPHDRDIQTLQAFGGYEGKSLKLGLQYAR